MKPTRLIQTQKHVFTAALAFSIFAGTAHAQTILLFEDWQDEGWSGTDINSVDNAPLSDFVGYGLNNNNPTTLLGAGTGGNVLRDQGGFGGTYGASDNSGNAVRVRSSNGAMLNENPLQLSTLGASTVTFSFDVKQLTANYVQVVEFSTDQAFTAPILLDTIDGNTDFGVWILKTYTLVNGVDATFTDDAYFRIRKLRPSPAGTNGGANSTFHAYDNLKIEIDGGVPADLVVTDITFAPSTNEVTLTWPKTGAAAFNIELSSDLIDWATDLGTGITDASDEDTDDAENITITLSLPAGFEGASKLFFRVEETTAAP